MEGLLRRSSAEALLSYHPGPGSPAERAAGTLWLDKAAPKTVELKLTRMHGGKPWMTAFDNPYVQAAGRAIEAVQL